MKTCLLPALVGVVVCNSATAAVIWTNPITGTNPNTSNPYTAGQVVEDGITVGGIARGSGINGNDANNRYNANGWNTTSIDLDAYFEFTITPDEDYEVDFESFVYTGQASGSGPTSFAFRTSVDGFTANLGSPAASGATISLSGAAFQNVTETITFRLYGWNASAAGGTFSVNDFSFNGTIVPEPTATLFGALGLLGILRRRRK